ncbi:MAG: 30S ribosomal protein THX [Bacteroidetes bacterium]|nr:30S ribosomal protein THX [Bacteroidota bacterium]
MGKGDRKTKRGKLIKGTFGNSRPRKSKQINAISKKGKGKKSKKKS